MNDIRLADLLYQRYSNPLELLDLMIQSGRLEEFLHEMLHIRKEEMEDKSLWEAWLHKIWDMEWSDYYASRNKKSSTTNAAPPKEKLTETVRTSEQILMNFCPYGGGEQGGTVPTDGKDSG